MVSTGILRRVDDLGRVVIPKEIRKILNIKEGDLLEIFVNKEENCVSFRPVTSSELWELLNKVADMMSNNKDFYKFAPEVYELARKIKKSDED